MDWKTHIAVGVILAGAAFYLFSLDPMMVILLSLFSGFSALLPDIDHKMSKIRSITDKLFILFAVIYSYVSCSTCRVAEIAKDSLVLTGIYFLILTFLSPRHRGITHSIFFVLMYGGILYFLFNFNLALAGMIGYVSHLLIDREIKLF